MAAVDTLRACALFKGFTDTGLQILAAIAHERAFPKGTPLFVDNMLGDSMFILASGTVRLTAKNAAGDEVTIGELSGGDYLGEIALIQQSQRMCTATAMSEVTAVELRNSDFQKLLGQKPQACLKLLMNVVALFGKKLADNRDAFRSLLPKA